MVESSRRIRVDIMIRNDASEKPGGDSSQAQAYARYLTSAGLDVAVRPISPSTRARDNAIIHVFNIDQPFGLLDLVRRSAAHPLFISPIHHSRTHVREMRRMDPGGMTRIASRLPEEIRSFLAFSASIAKDRSLSPLARVTNIVKAGARLPWLRASIKSVLNRADAVCYLSEREARSLVGDFGWGRRNGILTPNGAGERRRAEGDREPRILVVGRIEPRKRQLEILSEADLQAVPITFVGALNPNQGTYGRRFESAISRSTSSQWLGPLPAREVLDLMAHSSVLLNASWVEVQSLVDLEAAHQGCWLVVTTDGGSTADWLPGMVTEVPSDDLGLAVAAANKKRTDPEHPGHSAWSYPHTWETTSAILEDAYRRVWGESRLN